MQKKSSGQRGQKKRRGAKEKGAAKRAGASSGSSTQDPVNVEGLLAEIEVLQEAARTSVSGLRDGTYETDEKIRLFRERISKLPLQRLEEMFN